MPRTPAWSLKELHQEGASISSAEAVLDEDKLRELAELCHLRIDDEKLPSLLKDVESIIQCTKTIQALTLDENVDDLYAKNDSDDRTYRVHRFVSNLKVYRLILYRLLGVAPLREDVVTEGNYPEKILANAAEKSGYFFKVPKVLQD